MKIVAKGTVDGGYWGHGRKWPRETSIELEVTADELKLIEADPNIVCLVLPEMPSVESRQKAR